MSLVNHIENNMNANGGGLAVNITGRYESNRHAIAKIEKVTIGECCKFLKSKKGGGLHIDAKLLLSVFRKTTGRDPEWHHAGFLPRSYGGGMKKTYFFDEIPTKETVTKWLKKSSLRNVKNLVSSFNQENKKVLQDAFLKEKAKQFSRQSDKPNFAVEINEEMKGKFGWFEADYKYTLPTYYSGWYFENEQDFNTFNKI